MRPTIIIKNQSWFLLSLCLLTPFTQALETYQYEILERQDQDPSLFTQGFYFDGTNFYQSSGLYKKSYLIKFPAKDGKTIKNLEAPSHIFAEGITVLDGKLYLLSWRAGQAWRFDSNSFALEKEFRYSGEGWGLTHFNNQLIMSDGNDEIRFLSPENFSVQKRIKVTRAGAPLKNINELEYADGLIWANQWKSNLVYGIDPTSGEVVAEMDISALQEQAKVSHVDSVANGIAYDEEKQAFWLTGKYWKNRYLVKMIKPKSD